MSRGKIKRKKQTKKMIKKKNSNQDNEYHIWYINKTKSNRKGWN
jgi:hypothetical protein